MSVSPYVVTTIETSVRLYPPQMNNDIYINLKQNLKNKVVGKCFEKYGYVTKVIQIKNDYSESGFIEMENNEASALYNLAFSCRLCYPLKGTDIVCEVKEIVSTVIKLLNGPILFYSRVPTNINKQFFKINANGEYIHSSSGKKITIGSLLRVTIGGIRFADGDKTIGCVGQIQDFATPDEENMYRNDTQDESDDSQNEVIFEEYANIK